MRFFTDSDLSRAGLSLAFAALCFTLAGCGGNSKDSGNNNAETPSLVGTWRQVKVASGNETADCPGSAGTAATAINACSAADTFTFNSEGKFTANMENVPAAGNYAVRGGNLNLTVVYATSTPSPTPTPSATPGASPTPGPSPTPLELTNSVNIDFDGTDTFTLEYETGDVRFRDTFQRQIPASPSPTATATP